MVNVRLLSVLFFVVVAAAGEVPALVERLEDDAPAVRYRAAAALGALGGEARPAFPALIERLGDREPWVRLEAARALVRIGARPADVAPLIERLEHADLDLGQLVAEAIAGAGAEAVPALAAAVREGPGHTPRYALMALHHLGRAAAPAVPLLLEVSLGDEPALSKLASEALRRAAPWAEEAVPELVALLASEDERTRWAAATVLARIGPPASAAIPALRAMRESGTPRLQEAAAEALKSIDVIREPEARHPALRDPKLATEEAPAKFRVKFETTRGDFVVEVERAWAPRGADRFYNLVRIGFLRDIAFFRVVPDFVAQFGIHDDSKARTLWKDARIEDDPVKISNRRGTLTFATAGPGTRTTQMFLNLADNTFLDEQGFSPVGRVVEGMDVVDSLYSGYGDRPEQQMIHHDGNAYLKQWYPKLDYLRNATLVK